MGVHALWQLLAPAGHRVSVDTLAGQRLAVDVSIWLVQFLKAMRDESGGLIPHAHLIGMMRRVLRLLFHGVRPVFVFDGPAPQLKRRTVAQRRRVREQHSDSLKRMAEKILLGQLKMRSVQQLRKKLAERAATAKDSEEEQREGAKGADAAAAASAGPKRRRQQKSKAAGSAAATSASAASVAAAASGVDASSAIDVDQLDEGDCGEGGAQTSLSATARSIAAHSAAQPDANADAEPELIMPLLPEGDSDSDSADPHSERARQRRSAAHEAFVLPADGKVDAAVLAKLPISLQYEVLQQQREYNRYHQFDRFTAVEHDPRAFSALQMDGFLRSVQFSQSVDALRKEMNLMVEPPGTRQHNARQQDGRAGAAADGSRLLVQSALRIPSQPASGGFVYYKTTAPSAPFSWQDSIRAKKAEDARANRDAKNASERKRPDQREGMETLAEERARLAAEEMQARLEQDSSMASAVASAHALDDDWLCHRCAGVNTDLRKMDSAAAKNKCQTCGAKRELDGDADAPTAGPFHRPLSSSAPSGRSTHPASLPRSSALLPAFPFPAGEPPPQSSAWVSPAERYSSKPVISARGSGGAPDRVPSANHPPRAVAAAATSAAVRVPSLAGAARPHASALAAHVDDGSGDSIPALESAAVRSRHSVPLSASVRAALEDRDVVAACPHCTFINPAQSRQCAMCERALQPGSVALLPGPSTLSASFQDKAVRRVTRIAEEQAAVAAVQIASRNDSRAPYSGAAAAAAAVPRSGRDSPVDLTVCARPTVTITRAPAPLSAAPVAAAPSPSTGTGALDISFAATGDSGGKVDVVDELFASLLAAKSIAPLRVAPTAVAAPEAVQAPSDSAPRVSSATVVTTATGVPLSADFLEVSDAEEEDAREAERSVQAAAEAAARAESRRALERQEAAQLRRAMRESLRDPAAAAAVQATAATSQRKSVGMSMQPSSSSKGAAGSGGVPNLAEVQWPAGSAAEVIDVDDEELWEDDDGAQPQASLMQQQQSQPFPAVVSPSELATADSAAPVGEDAAAAAAAGPGESAPMDMDSESDEETTNRNRKLVKIEPRSTASVEAATVVPVSAPATAATSAAAPAPVPTPPTLAAAAPPQTTPPSVAVAASPAPPSISPVSVSAPSAPPSPRSPESVPVPLSRLDALTIVHGDDDEETLRDREQLQQLLTEIDDLAGSIQMAAQMEGHDPGGDDDRAPLELGAVEANDERPAQDTADSATAQAGLTTSPALHASGKETATVPVAVATAASSAASASGLDLPFGLTLNTSAPPSARVAASNAFLEQQRKRREQEEAQAERERQALESRREVASLGETAATAPGTAAAPVAAAASASPADVPMVWEAFPQHLTTAESVELASSFDSSYLEVNAAAKSAADARRGEAHVTDEMIADTQTLLQLFGIPFIVAPGEAEAQCATLETLGLVEGVITDDSDVFLFGAQNVYRHFFESKRYCERYRSDEIQNKLGIDRRKLIHMALLLGSDYTEGVKGVGIVNATEIINAFPGEHGLEQLCRWVYSDEADLQPSLPSYPDPCSDDERAALDGAYRLAAFKYAHRNVKRNWALSTTFPNREVIEAYWHPNVDESRADPTWQRPDWDAIRNFCASKIGWTQEQIQQQVAPVEKAMEEARAVSLDRYFSSDDQFAAIGSSRLSRAVRGLVHQRLTEEEVEHQRSVEQKKAEAAERRKKNNRDRQAAKKKEKEKEKQTADDDGVDDDAAAVVAPAASSAPSVGVAAGLADGGSTRLSHSSGPAVSVAAVSLLDDSFELSAADEATLAAADAAAAAAAAVTTTAASTSASKAAQQRKRKTAARGGRGATQ